MSTLLHAVCMQIRVCDLPRIIDWFQFSPPVQCSFSSYFFQSCIIVAKRQASSHIWFMRILSRKRNPCNLALIPVFWCFLRLRLWHRAHLHYQQNTSKHLHMETAESFNMVYTWYIPGITFTRFIHLVYTWYIIRLCILKIYMFLACRMHIPLQ